MKLRLFIAILTLTIVPSLFAMQTSWVSHAWQWYKQNKALYKEVKKIVQSGSTVKETETLRVKKEHEKALENFKRCAGLTNEQWQDFQEKRALVKAQNNLFDTPASSSAEEKELYDPLTLSVRQMFRDRNLNPDAVDIEISSSSWKEHASQWFSPFGKIFNSLQVSRPTSQSKEYSLYAIGHEIAHLKEHHPAEVFLLSSISSKEINDSCFRPLRHQIEYEADSLSALENYSAAQNAFRSRANFYKTLGLVTLNKEYYDHPIKNEYSDTEFHPSFNRSFHKKLQFLENQELDGDSHPSNHKRATQLKRIYTMFRLENIIRAKQEEKATLGARLWKNLKQAFAAFNPTSNG